MALPKGVEKTARAFARAIIGKKWGVVLTLLAAELKEHTTAETLADEFGWDQLGPRLRQMHIALTREPDDAIPELDPPKRFEVFEVEERQPPAGLDSTIAVNWIEVDFQPAEDSEFDVCYNCFLAFVDEGAPRVIAFVIEIATE